MIKGLTSEKAEQLLSKFGLNEIKEQKKKPLILKFLEQFNNFLTLLLLIAAVLSLFIGEIVDACLIFLIVILNALFGIYQEKKAEEAVQSLKKMTVTKVRVIRSGKQIEIDSRFLVPGDLIYLEEGSKVPADAVIHETLGIEMNESALTGESLSVAKKLNEEIFMGTTVVKGRGTALVRKTGMQTKFGIIAEKLSVIGDSKTPLQRKLEGLTRNIGITGILLSGLIFIISLTQHNGYFPSFLLAVSLAVAVVPEGLPAVMTITLSIGINEMSKRKAIVKKLSAIEALGNITLIATDKTGTLTTNKMQVKDVYHTGKFKELLLDSILCSTASLVYVHARNDFDVLGDPTEGALLMLAKKSGLDPEEVRSQWKLIAEKPFDSVTKMMSVEVKNKKTTEKNIFIKGSPEAIINLSSIDPLKLQEINKTVREWSKNGLRVLGFAYSKERGEKPIFLGLTALHDAPRAEVARAIEKTKEAGIKVVMITGDSEVTAEAIGTSVGLMKKGDEIITGLQLDEYSDEELIEKLPKIKIFARTSPFHKSRIVKLYKKIGEIVAVTGDGVNDAIALKEADVGVAMGLIGTDVARETADLVITDDNFATIVNAVEEGRNIIRNLKNAVKYLLSCNISEALSLLLSLLLGIPNLFYPIQLLYINLVTDGFPALALAFSPRQDNLMREPVKKEQEILLKKDFIYISKIAFLSTFLIILSYYLFSGPTEFKKTVAFSVLTLLQSFIFADIWFSNRSILLNLSKIKKGIFIIAFFLPFILQFLILKFIFISTLFSAVPVSFPVFIAVVATSSFVLLVSRFLNFHK